MTPINGGPAFPRQASGVDASSQDGMSLRDYFAAQALILCDAGDVRRKSVTEAAARNGIQYIEALARMAYELADAMLAERAK